MNRKMTRREVLRWMALTAAASLVACQDINRMTPVGTREATSTQTATRLSGPTATQPQVEPTPQQAYLAVAHGADPAAITETALRALGGIERFVKNGYDVIIKPNICTDYYSFEYGATTNPVVVATLVSLALGAGARRVRVMDFPFGGTAESAYVKSGIADAVSAAGGEMELMNPNKFRMTPIPEGKSITEWDIYQDVLNCDLLIDVPIAKHHGLAMITVGGKNLLGVIQQRSSIHADMAERIPDLISVIRPGLTVVDAVRTLMQNGPTGGNLDDVKINNTVIVSHDIVAADSYAAGLFNLTGADVPYIAAAAQRGLGKMDLSGLKIEEVNL
ncbi:MAG TPA: DUF362 domain-containing protein [Anaerolineaceae bacterium]|nr:DUF362 domain-containing protein [Anaerolineaceae bacterium]